MNLPAVRIRSLALATLLFALAAAPASGAPVALGGSPLNVQVDSLGQLQAVRAGTNGIFFPSTSTTGDAGFFLAIPGGTSVVYGFDGAAGPSGLADYTPVSPGSVTGTGSLADPLRLVTRYDAGSDADIEQVTTYVNGSQQFRVHWKVTNTSGAPLAFKAIAAADFYFDGSDRGTGIFTEGPPRFIGGTNADTGNSGGFEEVSGAGLTAWSDYQALAYGDDPTEVWGKVEGAGDSTANTFDNTVLGEPADNAGAVEWNRTGTPLANNASIDFELVVRNAVPAALQLSPPNAGSPQGVPINFTATALDTNGQPYAGRTLRWTISGVNPGTGSTTLAANGTGVITDAGANSGADTVVAFVDFNNNGVREAAEPQASALATFVDNIRPTCSVKVSGDRPGGGGAGKPLVIRVDCSEGARVTVSTSLIAPGGAAASDVAGRKKKPKRKRKVTIKLKSRTVTVGAGPALPVRISIPKRVARKYAGRTLQARITVRATDTAGNVKTATATRSVKLAKIKKKPKKRPKRRRG